MSQLPAQSARLTGARPARLHFPSSASASETPFRPPPPPPPILLLLSSPSASAPSSPSSVLTSRSADAASESRGTGLGRRRKHDRSNPSPHSRRARKARVCSPAATHPWTGAPSREGWPLFTPLPLSDTPCSWLTALPTLSLGSRLPLLPLVKSATQPRWQPTSDALTRQHTSRSAINYSANP